MYKYIHIEVLEFPYNFYQYIKIMWIYKNLSQFKRLKNKSVWLK